MTLPIPFAYPTTHHLRRHGPKGYQDYGDYKPFLRDEFTFRCVYCLERELWHPNWDGSFSADHFIPKAVAPDRETDYENLVYACVRCNSYKNTNLISLDPTQVAFSTHFTVSEDGHIAGLSEPAKDLIDLLDLDHDPALSVRRRILQVLTLKQKYPDDPVMHELFLGYFAFPQELPDLSRRNPPRGNSKPHGVKTSYYEQRRQKTLSETY
jgi:hypothetical protein